LNSRIVTAPNILTLARLIAVPLFLMASFAGRYRLAFVLFVAAALTDLFDGIIARRFNQRSRLGALLDPAADKTMMVCGYLFYTLHPRVPFPIPPWMTFTVLIRDVLIVVFAYLMYTRLDVKRFPPSWAGKTSMVAQAVTLAVAVMVNAYTPALRPLCELLFRITVVLTLYSGWGYLHRGRRLLDTSLALDLGDPATYNPRLAAGSK
jgi:cardiolipin synthase (CMP-forming)